MISLFLSVTTFNSISVLHGYVSTFCYENCNEHLNNIYSFGQIQWKVLDVQM